MKKHQLFLLSIIICLLTFCGVALADTWEEDVTALQEADSFDTQLAVLDKIATENADELEFAGWEWEKSLYVAAAPGVPGGLIPEDWENATFENADTLPEAMQGGKFIALFCTAYKSEPILVGDLLARFPADMRAGSLEEAEYALIVRENLVPSGYVYTPHASSFHRDYEAYAVDMETGEMTRFWSHRNYAKKFGTIGQLDGDRFTQRELWVKLRPTLFGKLRFRQADDTVLLFGISGENCFLMGSEGELTNLNVPDSVDGYAVIEIADQCFKDEWKLKTVTLPEGLRRISDEAFLRCNAMERLELPSTLESIGPGAFNHCYKLAHLVFSEGIVELPDELFFGCGRMASCYFPASLAGSSTGNLSETRISKYTTIYAPEGSYALQWAKENGYDHVICDDPGEMPDFEYVTEGDYEFLICRDEAAFSTYLGSDADVIVPEMVDDVPVTSILYHAFYEVHFLRNLTLPPSIVTVHSFAIEAHPDNKTFHLYVTNPETSFEQAAVLTHYPFEKVTIHAPVGSLAERYVLDRNEEHIVFEAWDDAVN